MVLLGSFISFKSPKYLIGAMEDTLKNQATALMIYLGAPQTTKRSDPAKWQLEEFRKNWNNFIKPEHLIVHAPYIVNLANFEKAKFAIDFLTKEIQMMNLIGAKYLVLHPGAFLKQDQEETLKFLAKNLKKILNQTEDVTIALETMAGKGSEIGTNLEQLKLLIDLVDDSRIGICLDTCHMWDAGYDLKTDFEENNGQNLINLLINLNLMDRVKVIHLNDSKNPIGSKKDRHENIGKGHIGLKALKNIVHHPAFAHVAKILETPYEEEDIYQKEIALLKQI